MNVPLLDKIKCDYPSLKFRAGKKFAFRPPKTVVVGPAEPNDSLLLLHELGHALSSHTDFKTGVDRLRMEREAWDKARELAAKYEVEFDEEFAQSELDTYREWLHKKSRCPKCGLTRFQDASSVYHCPRCENLS